MPLPLVAAAGAKLLPLVSKLAGTLGPTLAKFTPTVSSLLSKVTTAFPQVATMSTKVAGVAAKHPVLTQVGSLALPGQPFTSLGAAALANPSAMSALKTAWLAGMPK